MTCGGMSTGSLENQNRHAELGTSGKSGETRLLGAGTRTHARARERERERERESNKPKTTLSLASMISLGRTVQLPMPERRETMRAED